LPYLEISRETQEVVETIEMPNVTGLTFEEAKKILKESEIEVEIEMESSIIITEQLPKAGIQITKGTKVILYGN